MCRGLVFTSIKEMKCIALVESLAARTQSPLWHDPMTVLHAYVLIARYDIACSRYRAGPTEAILVTLPVARLLAGLLVGLGSLSIYLLVNVLRWRTYLARAWSSVLLCVVSCNSCDVCVRTSLSRISISSVSLVYGLNHFPTRFFTVGYRVIPCEFLSLNFDFHLIYAFLKGPRLRPLQGQ